MSGTITVTLLAGLVLTACLTSRGCGRHRLDSTWRDSTGQPMPEKWKTDTDCKFVLDANGRKLPDPHPRDNFGQLWVYDANGNLVPPAPPRTSTHYYSSYGPSWFWGGNGYRSYSSGSPSPSPSPSSPRPAAVTTGGFGHTGVALSGGS